MTAALVNEKGDIVRTWETCDRKAALTADRNCPSGYSVVIICP